MTSPTEVPARRTSATEKNDDRMRPTNRTVFSLAVAGVVCFNILAASSALIGIKKLYDRSISEAEIRSQNLALAIEQSVGNEIGKIDLSLKTVIAEFSGHENRMIKNLGRGTPMQHILDQQRALLAETEGWIIANAAGRIVFVDADDTPDEDSVADRDYFSALATQTGDELFVSRPLVSRRTGNHVVVFARAIRNRQGDFLGAVIVPLPVSHLHQLFSGFDLGDKGALSLRDNNLGIIAGTQRSDEAMTTLAIGDSAVSTELSRLIAAKERHATYRGIRPRDGENHIASFRRLNNAPIFTVASLSRKESLAEWRRISIQLLSFLGLSLLIGNGGTVLLYRLWLRQQRDAHLLRISNRHLEASLGQLKERDCALIAAQEAGALGTFSLDLVSGSWTCSEKFNAIVGIDTDHPRTFDSLRALVHEEDRSALSHYFHNEVIQRRQPFDREYRLIRPDNGKTLWVHCLGSLDDGHGDTPVRLTGTVQDISERKFAEERLRLTDAVFQTSTEGILVADRCGTVIETNPAFATITGYPAAETLGQPLWQASTAGLDETKIQQQRQSLLESGSWEGESLSLRRDGTRYVQRARMRAIRDAHGNIAYFCMVISDVTEFKEAQHRLEHMAYYDELTDLPNRVLLADRMQQAMAQCRRRSHEYLGVCYLDLDNFKFVNDQHGHAMGNRLLREVALRLKRCTRSGDTVARLGGDEFVVLFCNLGSEDEVEPAVRRLMQCVAEPYRVDGIDTDITICAGVTIYPSDTIDEPDVLIRHADQAMYEAKRTGKNRIRFFDPEGERRQREHQETYDRLVEALARNEFRLYYQPKVDLRSGAVIGVEALIRWQHPEKGLLQPASFLPAIEMTDLTLPVGEWILHEALQQQRQWLNQGIDLAVSVNIFTLHLQRPDFAERLEMLLSSYPELDPGRLELEILETTALEDLGETTARIRDCMRLGVRFSLDDFGTGFSSLNYLRQLPAETVKIDRSFVRDMLRNSDDQALVRGIVGMAQSLQRNVIAEGVETIEHGVPLLRCGCQWAQGYGIARPMPPERIPEWMAQWTMPESWKAATLSDILYFGNVDA